MARYDRFGLIYQDIFDSSVSWDWEARVVWMDLVILAANGDTIPMSRKQIAHRTKVPLEVVTRVIDILMAPDPESRCQEFEGRKLEQIEPGTDASGFRLLTSAIHRKQSEEERRESRAVYMRRRRAAARAERDVPVMKVGKLVIENETK